MREKRPALVITFPTTAAAMGCESLCIERGLPGRTIPVPGEVAAGCGLAWKASLPMRSCCAPNSPRRVFLPRAIP